MYIPDLATSCAIGWLEHGQPFPQGAPHPDFVTALKRHVDDAGRWLPLVTFGAHFCDLGPCENAGSAQYVVIPAPSCFYVAPELITHYVERHQYAPPDEFVTAVLACPEQSSSAYVDLLLPFASTWRLTADDVRHIAQRAPAAREQHAAAVAQAHASKGGFRW